MNKRTVRFEIRKTFDKNHFSKFRSSKISHCHYIFYANLMGEQTIAFVSKIFPADFLLCFVNGFAVLIVSLLNCSPHKVIAKPNSSSINKMNTASLT